MIPKLEIYDPAGNKIQEMSDTSQVLLEDFVLKTGGDYLLRISDKYSEGTGTFILYLYVLERDKTTPIQHNQELRDAIDPVGDVDKFSFYGTQGSNLTVILNRISGGLIPEFKIYDPSGKMIQKMNDTSQVLLRDYKLEQTGDYLIRVSDKYSESIGEYKIFISFFPPPVYSSPTPTTGITPNPSPVSTATPLMTSTPVPDAAPAPDFVYEFGNLSLAESGWSDSILSGFSGNPAGTVQMSPLEKTLFPDSNDLAGLLIHVSEGIDSVLQPYKPNEVCFLYGKESIDIGNHSVFIRALLKSDGDGSNAEIYLGALKGNLSNGNVDGSIAFISPKNSRNYQTAKYLSCYYKSDDETKLITPFIQIAAKKSGNNATIYVDRIEIFILKPGMKYDGLLFEE